MRSVLICSSLLVILSGLVACSGVPTSTTASSPDPDRSAGPGESDASSTRSSDPKQGVERIEAAVMQAALDQLAGRDPFAKSAEIGAIGPLLNAEALVVESGLAQFLAGDEVFVIDGLATDGLSAGESYDLDRVMITHRASYESITGQRLAWFGRTVTDQEWSDALNAAERLNEAERRQAMAIRQQQLETELAEVASVESWSAAEGGFSVEATFVGAEAGEVKLRREDTGDVVSVPLDQLDDASKDRAIQLSRQTSRKRAELERLKSLLDR